MITGFKISSGLAVIGAIVADFFFRQGDRGSGGSSTSIGNGSPPSSS